MTKVYQVEFTLLSKSESSGTTITMLIIAHDQPDALDDFLKNDVNNLDRIAIHNIKELK